MAALPVSSDSSTENNAFPVSAWSAQPLLHQEKEQRCCPVWVCVKCVGTSWLLFPLYFWSYTWHFGKMLSTVHRLQEKIATVR